MKYYFTFIISFLLALSTFAQQGTVQIQNSRNTPDYNIRNISGIKEAEKTIYQGSPYLIDEFKKGTVIYNSKDMEIQAYLKYDIYNDVFEIKVGLNDTYADLLDKQSKFDCILNGYKFVLLKSKTAINELHYNNGRGYAAELIKNDKKITLYKRFFAEKKEAEKARTSYHRDEKASIEIDVRYIFRINGNFIRVDAHKKRILEAFPDQHQKIEFYIKKNNLKFRGSDEKIERQVIQVVEYYNSL
jgi:hypothetical protein